MEEEIKEQQKGEEVVKYPYMVQLSEKLIEYGLTHEQADSKLCFEQMILVYAQQDESCRDIPEVKYINCKYKYNIMPLANFVIINYRGLSEEELSKIARFYDKKGIKSFTLREYEGYNDMNIKLTDRIREYYGFDDAICIELTVLCEKVMPHLRELNKY